MTQRHAVRGRVLTFTGDPAEVGPAASHRYLPDGLVVIEGGQIAKVGEAAALLPTLAPGTPVDHYPDQLVLPGLIDTHLHFPQTQVIASYGAQLLEWLQKYTFVEEQKFAEPDHAAAGRRLLHGRAPAQRHHHGRGLLQRAPESAEAFFAESHKRNTRMIAGKVMMDRGAPPGLLDTAQRGYDETKALIGRWHGQRRQLYAISPRFAPDLDRGAARSLGAPVREHPDCYVQTHLAENHDEIATARRLYPAAASYTDIYDRYGLLGPRSLFGHCIHLDEPELERLAATRSIAAFCPTSNLFIGSGLFDLAMMRNPRRPVRVSLATDVGGGTSYSMLRTAAEAYKVLQLRRQNLPAFDAFYLMTLGNARALSLEDRIGSLESGREADLVVLDARATPAMAHRMETISGDLAEELFVLMTMGDDRSVRATYVAGKKLHAA